jgi:cell division protein FtsQ
VWNDPWAMTLSARLILAATLVFTVYTSARGLAETYLPIRQVLVSGAHRPETRAALAQIVPRLEGSLFSMDLAAAKQRFEGIPWVRRAQVSRVWPARLRVDLAEHVPAASWNGAAVLNIQGEVFPVRPWPGLPDIHAPEGMEAEVAKRYGEYAAILGASGLRIGALGVDARHAWRLEVRPQGAGVPISVDLGRERMAERLGRFIAFYPLVSADSGALRRVDMRYPNGFAVEAAARAESNT